MNTPYNDIALRLAPIAREAGRLLRDVKKTHIAVRRKSDDTPTCPADTASETLIVGRLRAAFPDIPIISEERVRDTDVSTRFFLVDPLDGTADFIDGGEEYCVNIALIEHGRPVAAVIHAPSGGTTWLAGETANVASEAGRITPIAARKTEPASFTVLASNRYGDAQTETCLDALAPRHRLHISSAIKFCRIAEGQADLYLRLGRTMEWDTAAGDLLLLRAGGCVCDLDGQPLRYGKAHADYANGPFVALGDPTRAKAMLATCTVALAPT